MIKTDFLHHLNKFSLLINKRVVSNYAGLRSSQAHGAGLVLKDYIQYTPGDDYRRIDWRVFARTDKLFVKRYEEERNMTAHIIVDFSASMSFGEKVKKWEYAGMLGLGFAYMALKDNEKFVLSTFSDKLDLFRPKRGRKNIAAIIDYLNSRKPNNSSKLYESISKYSHLIASRSLVVIISDFLYQIDEIKNALYKLKNSEVKLIQVLDPVETKLEIEGDYKLKDLETSAQMRVNIDPAFRRSYFGRLSDHQAKIKQACDEIGAEFFIANTQEEIFDVFYKILG